MGDVQLHQIGQSTQYGQVSNGVVGQNDLLKTGQILQRLQVPDGVVGQIQLDEPCSVLQAGQGAESAIRQVQLLQSRQGSHGSQTVRREPAAGEIQLFQVGQFTQVVQVAHAPSIQRQRFQIGHVLQVFQGGHVIRNSQLCNLPQVVGVKDMGGLALQDIPHGAFHIGIHKDYGLNNAADGITENGNGTYKPIVRYTDGVDLGLSGGQLNGGGIRSVCDGGIVSVGGVVQCSLRGRQGDADILAIVAGFVVRRRGRGPQSLQLAENGGVCNVGHQCLRVQQLVLLHVGFAESHIELLGGSGCNGLGQSDLCFGIVPGRFILIGQLNGHIFVLAGVIIGQVVKPGGQAAVAGNVVVAGLLQQKVPGEVPVVYK